MMTTGGLSLLLLVFLISCSGLDDWTTAEFEEEFPYEYMREQTLCLNGDWEYLLRGTVRADSN